MKSNLLTRLNSNAVPVASTLISLLKSTKNKILNRYYSFTFKSKIKELSKTVGIDNNSSSIIKNKIVLCEVTNHLGMQSRVTYLSAILANHHDATILFCSFNDKDALGWLRNGIAQKNESVNIIHFSKKAIRKSKKDARSIYEKLHKPEDIFKIQYEGIFIGDLIYDQVLRFGKWQASVWEINDKVLYTIERNLIYMNFYKEVYEKYQVVSTVGSHTVGVISTLQRFFAYHRIPSYLPYNAILKYTRFDGSRLPYYVNFKAGLIRNILNDKKIGPKILQEADNFIQFKFTGKAVFDIDSPRAFNTKKKTFTNREEFCQTYEIPNKPCVFIMLHAFNDHPHHFEDGLFLDYYIWFKETLNVVTKNDSVNWIIKEHPTSELYPMDIDISDMISQKKSRSILFLDADSSFNTASVKNIAHCVLTAVGTAGLENACFGIPCIITGPNHYSGHNIAIEPNSKREYNELLISIHDHPLVQALNESQRKKARVLYYLSYHYLYGQSGDVTQIVARNTKNAANKNKRVFLDDLITNLNRFEQEGLSEKIEAFIDSNEHTLYIDPNLRQDLDEITLTKSNI